MFSRPGFFCKKVVDEAARYFVEKKPQVEFVHFSDPDERGHAVGWMTDPSSRPSATPIECLGTLVDAVSAAGLDEETLFILSADHGGHGRNHSGRIKEDRLIPWIAWGPGVSPATASTAPISTVDTAATALWALGYPPPPGWWGGRCARRSSTRRGSIVARTPRRSWARLDREGRGTSGETAGGDASACWRSPPTVFLPHALQYRPDPTFGRRRKERRMQHAHPAGSGPGHRARRRGLQGQGRGDRRHRSRDDLRPRRAGTGLEHHRRRLPHRRRAAGHLERLQPPRVAAQEAAARCRHRDSTSCRRARPATSRSSFTATANRSTPTRAPTSRRATCSSSAGGITRSACICRNNEHDDGRKAERRRPTVEPGRTLSLDHTRARGRDRLED